MLVGACEKLKLTKGKNQLRIRTLIVEIAIYRQGRSKKKKKEEIVQGDSEFLKISQTGQLDTTVDNEELKQKPHVQENS